MTSPEPLLAASPTPEAQGRSGPVIVDRDWLHVFALEVRRGSLSALSMINTCVLTTRIGMRVLDRVGVVSQPTPVYVAVHNMQAWRLASQGVPVPAWPNSAHSVGVDERTANSPTQGWNGHLVLVVKQPGHPRLLVDLTADQFDRPIRNLTVGGPVFMDIGSDATWTPKDPLFTIVGRRDDPDAIISYRPMPPMLAETRRWQHSPDWVDGEAEIERFVDRVVERLPGLPTH